MQLPTPPSFTLSSRIEKLTGSVARDILARTESQTLLNLAGGLPDPTLWSQLAIPIPSIDSFQYGSSQGERPLRNLIASQYQSLGLPSSADTVLITSGSQQGLDLAAKLVIEKDTPVLLEAPTYLAALQVFNLFQASLHSLPIGVNGIDPENLDTWLSKTNAPLLYLNPTFQNPSGLAYDLERRQQIAAVLDRHQCILLEDDPYRDIFFESAPPPPISSFLKRARWIYLSSVSKTLVPGLRIGALSSHPDLFSHLLKLKQAADLHTNRPAQLAAFHLLSDKSEHANRLATIRRHYREKRDILCRALSTHLNDLATWQIPEGGMFVWLELKQSVDLAGLLETCLSHDLAIMPGTPFFARPDLASSCIRLNFTCPPASQLPAAIETLATCLRSATKDLPIPRQRQTFTA